ncbi:MAG: beta-phosphoglucomutase [Clostridia bacterium]|nr:beta-phosphoglucomutase [Clostridia bacterium]
MKNNIIKGIIFDLDGVLLFTDKYHYMAWKALADKLNIPFDEKVNDRLRGVSRMDSLEIILSYSDQTFSSAEKEVMAEEKNGLYRSFLQKMTPSDVSDETRAVLEKLREMGLKLAIGSSSKNTPLILEKTDLAKYFHAVSDGNNISRSKPDPEVFLKAAAYLNLKPSECIVVEDAEAGIDAGRAGGFTTVGIGCAAQYEKTDRPIKSLAELIDYNF